MTTNLNGIKINIVPLVFLGWDFMKLYDILQVLLYLN